MSSNITKMSFTSNLVGTSKWFLGATHYKGVCALTGESFPAHTPVLWKPCHINKNKGIVVLLSNYVKFVKNGLFKSEAEHIELPADLIEKNEKMFKGAI